MIIYVKASKHYFPPVYYVQTSEGMFFHYGEPGDVWTYGPYEDKADLENSTSNWGYTITETPLSMYPYEFQQSVYELLFSL